MISIRNRDRNDNWVLGDPVDSQIGKGVWEGDWKDPICPKVSKRNVNKCWRLWMAIWTMV